MVKCGVAPLTDVHSRQLRNSKVTPTTVTGHGGSTCLVSTLHRIVVDGTLTRVTRVQQLLWIRHPSNQEWKGLESSQQLSAQQQQQELDRDLRLAFVDLYSAPVDKGGSIRVVNRDTFTAGQVCAVATA